MLLVIVSAFRIVNGYLETKAIGQSFRINMLEFSTIYLILVFIVHFISIIWEGK